MSDDHAPTTPRALWSSSVKWGITAILLLVLATITGANLLDILNSDYFHEELRLLYHFDPARTNDKDYIGRFLSALPQPLLYSYVTKFVIGAGVDLIGYHKLLTIFCWLLMLVGSALAGLRIGGTVGATAVTVLIACQANYSYQINSAVPHAFAFPLAIFSLVCLLYERPYMLAALTVLAGLVYPPISPILGASLAWQLMIVRKCWAADNPRRVADLLVLGLTGAIAMALLWHQLTPVKGYGAVLPPGARIDIYPENGPQGRHFYGVFHPLAYVVRISIWQFRQVVPPPIVIVLMAFYVACAGYGLWRLHRSRALFQAFMSFILPALVICGLVLLLRPYLAYRFVLYPLFTVLPVLFVCGLLKFVDVHGAGQRDRAGAVVVILSLYVLSLNSMDTERNGFSHQLDQPSNRLMDFVDGLPAGSLLAAWPGDAQSSLIPYVAGRPLFVTHKAHYPSYEGHLAVMRARMNDLIAAYLAQDVEPIRHLRCRWQVDFLIVDRNHFSADKNPPDYFAPFTTRIKQIISAVERSELVLHRPPAAAVVFTAGRFVVVDLARLLKGEACPAAR